LSAVPMALTLKETLATVEEGAEVVVPDALQTAAVIPDVAPKVASAPKEPEDGLLSKVVSAPSSVAIGKGNIETSSSSDDDSSGSDSGSGTDSRRNTSSSSHVGKPVKPSFPVGVGTAVVSTAELISAVSAASVAATKLLGTEQHLFLKVLQKRLCWRLMVLANLRKLMVRQWMRTSWLLPMIFLRKSRKMLLVRKRRKTLMVRKSRKMMMMRNSRKMMALKSRMQPW
jgi:hypothetical protein